MNCCASVGGQRPSAKERGFLALGTDVTKGNGIGAFSLQILESLARLAPKRRRTVLGLKMPPNADLPVGWRPYHAKGRLQYVAYSLSLALRQRPSEIIVFHISLMPVAFVMARLVGARITLVAYGWEIILSKRRMERWCAYRTDRIAAISRLTAIEVERLLRNSDARRFQAVQLLYPTWDRHNSTREPEARTMTREVFGFNPGAVVLLTVGRMDAAERCKGHDRVLDVLPSLAASYPELRYLIVGDGDDRNRLASRAEDLGVADRVTFAGHVEDVAACYAACDLYVMPSTQEGFGIVFLEALSSGLPVVAGGIDGSLDAVCWGELGFLCDPLQPTEVEGAIRRALQALDGTDRRVDPAFLQNEVEERFGLDALDHRVASLFGWTGSQLESTANSNSRSGMSNYGFRNVP
ncbi:MAG: glycosyltransferase [Acidimicrobiales bacterium]